MQEHYPTFREAEAALRSAGYRYDLLGGMWRGHRARTAKIARVPSSSDRRPGYVVTYSPAPETLAACSAASTSSDAQP
jgi:hypothetical protein